TPQDLAPYKTVVIDTVGAMLECIKTHLLLTAKTISKAVNHYVAFQSATRHFRHIALIHQVIWCSSVFIFHWGGLLEKLFQVKSRIHQTPLNTNAAKSAFALANAIEFSRVRLST
ncbi:hypothetical protein, partial [Acinetobacter baumannii]|uniref:hypothetical protein n=1 Tax=Acinetobacter baumannii TaxID=470 RepID=UPI001BB14F4B